MRLLLVEDEKVLAASVKRSLAADGFAVDVSHTGPDGLWQAREGAYDAIVLDIMLPGLNGYAVCRKLREGDNWTPVLMLTAKEGEYDEADAFEVGADDYLRKPFSHVVLIARLRALTRRGRQPTQVVLSQDDLRLNIASMKCSRQDVEIELTPREFAVLEALLRRSPRVVAKRELINSVWGMDFEGDPNIAEVYVGYLRRKIDKPFNKNTIKTIRGVGYQIG